MHGRTSSLLLVFLVLGSLVPSDGFCVLPYSPSITRALALKGGQGITMSEGSHCKFSTADGQEVEGYMAGKKAWREKESAAGRVRREPSDTVGGVVVLLDVFGVRDEMNLRWMDRLAADTGLLVFAPDLFRYGNFIADPEMRRGKPWDPVVYGGSTSSPAYETWRQLHPPERVFSDIAAGSAFLRSKLHEEVGDSGLTSCKFGAVGFCFGGGRLLEGLTKDLFQGQVYAAVAFYPTRVDPKAVQSGLDTTAVLGIFGDGDELATPQLARDLEGDGGGSKPRKMSVYQGCGHAFAHRQHGESDVASASEAANKEAVEWLRKHLS